jgi:hypothetical protein
VHLLTIHDYHHILDKTGDDLEGLRCSHPSLLLGESIEPLEHRMDIVFSQKLLSKFLCVVLSQAKPKRKKDSLNLPCLNCLVANERMERSSTSILKTILVIAAVGGILV